MASRVLKHWHQMRIWGIFREAGSKWYSHNAPRLGAALAYYTTLSLAPALIVVIAICDFVFGDEAVKGQVYWQFRNFMGDQGAAVVQTLLKAAHRPGSGIIASVLGFLILLVGASAVFNELRDTLNYIWDVPNQGSSGFWRILRYRFLSFAMVLGAGLLLMASLLLSAIVQAAGAWIAPYISMPAPLLQTINFLVAFFASVFLFAVIYEVMPEVRVKWKELAIGSVITAVLFAVGKVLIGLYLRKAAVGSAYGAAGSLVVLLVWVYYSSQIFLYGAEVMRAYSRHTQSQVAA
jgi:membrane protein